MSEGWIYCLSNESYAVINDIPLLKIGRTSKEPSLRVKQLSSETACPLPFKLEFAKNVKNHEDKEKTLHILLEQYTDRVNPKREFFRITLEGTRAFFDLMDGEYYGDTVDNDESVYSEEEGDDEIIVKPVKCRDMSKWFEHGTKVRHRHGFDTWVGVYDKPNNCIIYDGVDYKSPSGFSAAHYKKIRPDRTSASNGWAECEYFDGEWKKLN